LPRLGGGGTGVVYEAQDLSGENNVGAVENRHFVLESTNAKEAM